MSKAITVHGGEMRMTKLVDKLDGVLVVCRALALATGMGTNEQSSQIALAKVVIGDSLGLEAGAAIRGIHFINAGGKTQIVLSADLMAGVIRSMGWDFEIERGEGQWCKITASHPKWKPRTYKYTLEMARKAKLTNKPVWQIYADDMLYARCMGRIARMCEPGALMGIHTPAEFNKDESKGLTDESAPNVTIEASEDPLLNTKEHPSVKVVEHEIATPEPDDVEEENPHKELLKEVEEFFQQYTKDKTKKDSLDLMRKYFGCTKWAMIEEMGISDLKLCLSEARKEAYPEDEIPI